MLRTDTHPSEWYQDVRTQAEVPLAERRLFSSLKGEFEGFVDRYFNRKLSRWFTRVFLVLGLSPNAITMIATVIGILAAAEFGIGTYSAGIIAALLFQWAAVIDCCDGEVARLTFTESPFGAWLDIAMDNLVHMAIFAGIAVGAYQRAAGQEGAWIPLALGASAIVGNAFAFLLVNPEGAARGVRKLEVQSESAFDGRKRLLLRSWCVRGRQRKRMVKSRNIVRLSRPIRAAGLPLRMPCVGTNS